MQTKVVFSRENITFLQLCLYLPTTIDEWKGQNIILIDKLKYFIAKKNCQRQHDKQFDKKHI